MKSIIVTLVSIIFIGFILFLIDFLKLEIGKTFPIISNYENDFPACFYEGKCEFKVTSKNIYGSGNYWHYGVDESNYYSTTERENGPEINSIQMEKANSCDGFDQFDILTWTLCDFRIILDCDAIKSAKHQYENNSKATEGKERYLGEVYRDYSCEFPEQ